MEEVSVAPKDLLQNAQKDLELELVPQQRETLANISTSTERKLLSEELAAKIDSAFAEDYNFTSKEIYNRAINLDSKAIKARLKHEDIDELPVREVGDYLVRKTTIDRNLSVVEVFDSQPVPFTDNKEMPPHNYYRYVHHIVVDNRTGLAAELLDLNKGKATYLSVDRSDGSGYIPQENVTTISNSTARSKEASSLHEAGHSHLADSKPELMQQIIGRVQKKHEGKVITDSELASFVAEERNAWAFALQAVRVYARKGVDMRSVVNYRTPGESLSSYDKSIGREGFRFNKAKE